MHVVTVCSTQCGANFWSSVAHVQDRARSRTLYVSLMIIQNKTPCGASLWRCSGFSCQGCKRNYRRHTHTHTHALIGSHFHTARQFGLCNPQYPEELRSSGCWQRTLDDTLSLSGEAPDCAGNMWGPDTEMESKEKAARRPWNLPLGKSVTTSSLLEHRFSNICLIACVVIIFIKFSSFREKSWEKGSSKVINFPHILIPQKCKIINAAVQRRATRKCTWLCRKSRRACE